MFPNLTPTSLEQILSSVALPQNQESVFAEIILPNATNIIVGTIYRHPCMKPADFNSDYLKPLLHKISTERKKELQL